MFNESLVDVPSDDLYYLLQTFSSMALSRDLKEWDFVVRVSMDIFQVCNLLISFRPCCRYKTLSFRLVSLMHQLKSFAIKFHVI